MLETLQAKNKLIKCYVYHFTGGNLIVTPPMNTTVLESERAELECLPKSPEWAVQWYREGVPVEALPELALRTEMAINGSLVIRKTVSTDLGEYECRISAPDGQVQSASAFLDVQCLYLYNYRLLFISINLVENCII